jgi:diaminohydroxyphosphoribosylaminopyrimidine deaminase / 5-amino-6-(5-phosphoribosylamino)uracil reductase
MRRALLLAARGRGATSPNPMVGATVVLPDGTIAGDGWHRQAGTPHAEVHALQAAGPRARGATLICTLEPCCHHGRTGPCTDRVIAAGIKQVVVAIEDPNPRVAGEGLRQLAAHGIAVRSGVERDAAARLNAPFFTVMRHGRPWVILKAAASADGRVAAQRGVRTAISSDEATRRVQRLRAEVDAIGVGSETMLVDDPLLTVRDVVRPRPFTRVIFDRRLRTPTGARVLTTLRAGPVIVVTTEAAMRDAAASAEALAQAGARLIPAERLAGGLRALAADGIQSLLLEGGPTLHRAFVEAGMIDEVQVFVAPHALGDRGVPMLDWSALSLASLSDLRAELVGPDVLVKGYVHRPH